MANYGWGGISAPKSCDYIAPAVIDLLASSSSHKVLGLGCGNGSLCRKLDGLGFSVVGVEPSRDGWQFARDASPLIPYFQLGVDDDPGLIVASQGLFDVVVSTEVVEHLYSPHLLPAFAWQLLKPGGILIVTTPYHGYLKNIVLALAGKWDHHHTALWCGSHIKFWSRTTLAKLLENAGFAPQAFYGVGRLPWLWKSMIIVAKKPVS